MSRGKFGWTRAGLVGPYTYQDRPETAVDASRFNCLGNMSHNGNQLCPGASGTWEVNAIPAAIRLAAQDVDFSRYDTNPRDGKIETHELAVVYVGANPPLVGRDEVQYPATFVPRPVAGRFGFTISGLSKFPARVSTLRGSRPCTVRVMFRHCSQAA